MIEFRPGPSNKTKRYRRARFSGLALSYWAVLVPLVLASLRAGGQVGSPSQCMNLSVTGTPATTFSLNRLITLSTTCPAAAGGGTIGVQWGDGAGSSGPGPDFTSGHTYAASVSGGSSEFTPPPPPYDLVISDGSGSNFPAAETFVSFSTTDTSVSALSGQLTTTTSVPITAKTDSTRVDSVVCLGAVDSNGVTYSADQVATQLHLACSSPDLPVTIPSFNTQPAGTPIRVNVSTSGIAPTATTPARLILASLSFPMIALFGFARLRHWDKLRTLFGFMAVLALSLSLSACGGGFRSPVLGPTTPGGIYQVTVATHQDPMDPGFVQTTLIVPITVDETQ